MGKRPEPKLKYLKDARTGITQKYSENRKDRRAQKAQERGQRKHGH